MEAPSPSPKQRLPHFQQTILSAALVFILLVSILPLGVLSVVYQQALRNAVIMGAQDSSLQLAELEADRFKLYTDDTTALIVNIHANQDLQYWIQLPPSSLDVEEEAQTKFINDILKEYSHQNPGIRIDLYNSRGKHYTSAQTADTPEASLADLQDRLNQMRASTKMIVWGGGLEEDSESGAAVPVIIASTLYSVGQAKDAVFPIGLITITCPVSQILVNPYPDDLDKTSIPQKDLIILDENNQVIYSSFPENTSIPVTNLANFFPADKSDVKQISLNGTRLIAAYDLIESTGWKVFTTIPVQSVLNRNLRIADTLIYLYLAILALLILASIWFLREIVAPINRLTGMFQAIQANNFDWNTQPPQPVLTELKELYYWFNAFLDSQKKNQAFENQLRISESRYHSLFNHSPIATWEEDFSLVLRELDQLASQGITDFESYFTEHISLAKSYLSKIRIVEVNEATLKQYHAHSLSDIIENFGTILKPTKDADLLNELLAIAHRTPVYENQVENYDLAGNKMDLNLLWTVAPGYETTLERIFVTTMNITEQKRDEKIQKALYQISQAASSTKDLDDLYRSIHRVLNELMPAENLYIALYDVGKDELRYVYFVDEFDKKPGPIRHSRGLTQYVLRTGKSFLASTEEFNRLVKEGQITPMGAASIDWMGVPLMVDDRIIGVLAVQIYQEGVHYTFEQLDILTFVSNQIAMAIDRKQAEENLLYTSTHDPITGIYNRAYFEAEVNRLSNGRQLPISVVIADIDELKKINDRYGHPVGDELIRNVAGLLKSIFRGSDVVARFGGDEFGVLLPFADETTVNKIISRMYHKIETYNETAEIKISLSIGTSTVMDGNDLVEAINLADQNMYQAKIAKKAKASSPAK